MAKESTSIDHPKQSYDNRIRPLVALRAWQDLRKDKEDTGQVFKMIGALKGKSVEHTVRRMKQHETGHRLLAEKPNILDVLEDRERLRAMPEGSLGRAYLYFMESEGFTAQGLIDASAQGAQASQEGLDPDVAWMGSRMRDLHDLYHVSTGYGRDPLGELCVVGLGNVQNRNRGIGFLVFMGRRDFRKRLPNLPIEKCFKEAKSRGRNAVFMAAVDWESLLDKPLEDVRKELRLTKAETYEATRTQIEAMPASEEVSQQAA